MLKPYLVATILGLFFSLGFAPNDLWFLSIFSLTCVHFLIQKNNKRELFFVGYFFGIGLWTVGISWLYVSIHYYGNIGILWSSILTLLFILIISIYSGLTLLLYNYLRSDSKILSIFSLPIAWIVVEYLRSILFTGFPWLISGTMLATTPLDGWTPIIGAQGNTFFLLLLSSLFYHLISNLKYYESALLSLILLMTLVVSSLALKNKSWT